MPVFFESIAYDKANRQLLAAWVIEGKAAGAKALFTREGDRYRQVCREATFPMEIADKIGGVTWNQAGMIEEEGERIFLEPFAEGRKLVICGGGHVALSLIRLGVMLDFAVTVIEDREEFAGRAREAGAHHVICRPFSDALDEMCGDLTTAFVIMTREHAHDVTCLRKILQKPYAYAGMMGSRSRTGQIREQMVREGYEERRVEQLHMPIGLPIGSRTPEEIAVSVMAELIQVMNSLDTGEGFPAGMCEELDDLVKKEQQTAHTDTQEPSGVLAMIVEKSGEAPRRPGTKMLIRKDGSFLGTIGGGYAEAEILKKTKEMLREGCRESRLIRISMKKGTMQCGGEITVFLLPL